MKSFFVTGIFVVILLMTSCMSEENDSLSAPEAAPFSSILSENSNEASQEKDDSSESEESSLAEESPWSPADYPDPTLQENMHAGIFYDWEHLEYQTFESSNQYKPHEVVLTGLNDESNTLRVTISLPSVYSFGDYNRIMYDGGFSNLLSAGAAVYCDRYDAGKSFVENAIEQAKQRSVDFMLAGADYEMVQQSDIEPGSYMVTDQYVRCIFGEDADNLAVVYFVKAGEKAYVVISFSVSSKADAKILSLYDAIANSVEVLA